MYGYNYWGDRTAWESQFSPSAFEFHEETLDSRFALQSTLHLLSHPTSPHNFFQAGSYCSPGQPRTHHVAQASRCLLSAVAYHTPPLPACEASFRKPFLEQVACNDLWILSQTSGHLRPHLPTSFSKSYAPVKGISKTSEEFEQEAQSEY